MGRRRTVAEYETPPEELLDSALFTLKTVPGDSRSRIARRMAAIYREIYAAERLPAPEWIGWLEENAGWEARRYRAFEREYPTLAAALRSVMVGRAESARYDDAEELRLLSALHTLSALPSAVRPHRIRELAARLREVYAAERLPLPPWLEALAVVGERESAVSPPREEWEYRIPLPD